MIFQSGLNHLGHVFGRGGEGRCKWGLEKPVLKGSTAERKRAWDALGGQSGVLGVLATREELSKGRETESILWPPKIKGRLKKHYWIQ